MRERPVVLSGRFTRQEEKIIERVAKKQDCSVSEYVRGAVMAALVLDGDFEAIKLLGGMILTRIAEKARLAAIGKRVAG